MTDAEPEDTVTVTKSGVTVEKSFEPDDFPVPAIAFRIRSDRDATAIVRLAETVPDDVAPENIGFHPKYGAEFWDVEGGQIVFEREFAADEAYTTVYGLRGGDADTAERFMTEPTLETIDPVPSGPGGDGGADLDAALDAAEIDGVERSEEAEAISAPGSDAPATNGRADDAIAGEAGAEADHDLAAPEGTDADAADADDTEPEPETQSDADEGGDDPEAEDDLEVEAETEAASQGETPASPAERSGDDLGSGTGGSLSDGSPADDAEAAAERSVVSELAAEIRAADTDDEDLLELRDALGLDMATASVEARIEHLQSETADLAAYTDALEDFLDDEGSAQTLLEDVRDDYEETAERVDELEDELADARSELEGARSEIDDRLEALEASVEDRVDAELKSVREDLTELRSELDGVRADVDAGADARSEMEADVEALSEEIAEVAEMRDRLTNALSGLAGGSFGSAPDPGADESGTDAEADEADDADDADDADNADDE